MRSMPLIEVRLQAITLGQQRRVLWREVAHDLRKTFPEAVAGNAGTGQHLIFDETVQRAIDLKSVAVRTSSHR